MCTIYCIFICITRRNLGVEIGVPDTEATTLSELNKLEYLSPPLKKNKLIPNNIANTKAIFALIQKLTRLEASYLSWLEYTKPADFGFKSIERPKRSPQPKNNRFVSTSGLEKWTSEETQQQVIARKFGWPCVKLVKHSRRKTCYLTLDLPLLETITQKSILEIDNPEPQTLRHGQCTAGKNSKVGLG